MEKEDFKIKIFKKSLHFCNPCHSNNGKMLWPTLKMLFGRTVLWSGPPYCLSMIIQHTLHRGHNTPYGAFIAWVFGVLYSSLTISGLGSGMTLQTGGALSARIQFLEGSPLWIFLETFWKKFFWDFSGTCLTLKETKSRNLVSVAQSMWTRQTIFGDPGRKCPPPSLDRVNIKRPNLPHSKSRF